MTLKEWYSKAGKGTSEYMVYDILRDWNNEMVSCERLCEIYFNIASEAIGEENVRRERDKILERQNI